MTRLSPKGRPAQQLMSMLWAEDQGSVQRGRVFASTYRLLKLGLVWSHVDGLTVSLTDEGRKVARELMATPEGRAYMAEAEEEAQ